MTQTYWIEIDPVDTLFFRGTESMVAGENHEADTMFPPMPSTLTGAIRTAMLAQSGIPPKEYCDRPTQWSEKYPFLGTPNQPGFQLLGPLFRVGSVPLFPAPAHWMATLDENVADGVQIRVQAARPYVDQGLGLTGSVPVPFWVHEPATADMKPLAGYWVTGACFAAMSSGQADLVVRKSCGTVKDLGAAMLSAADLCQREERVGIALDRQRTVKEGHLYTTVHARLQPELRLLVGLVSNHPLCLDSQGVLQLGGEQRMCSYSVVSSPELPDSGNGNLLYALSPIAAELPDRLADVPRATAKLLRTGGWDMAQGFHKPLQTWFAPGTVIARENETALPGCIVI